LADAREKVKEDPASLENQLYLGEMLHLGGFYKEAEPVLRLAIELLEKQEPDREVMSLHPLLSMDTRINVLLADTLANLNKHSESIEFYEKIVASKADVPGMWQNYAIALTGAGLIKKSLRAYREAIRQSPHDKTLWKDIAGAYMELGRNLEFRLCIDVINQEMVRGRSRRNEDDILVLAELHLFGNDIATYEHILDELLERSRDYALAMVSKAMLRIVQGKNSEAISIANQILQINKEDVGALWIQARCFTMEGDFTKGKELAEKVLTISPAYTNAQIVLDELKRYEEKGASSTDYGIMTKSQGQLRLEQVESSVICPTVRDVFSEVQRVYLASSGLGQGENESGNIDDIELGEFSFSISHPVDESNFGLVKSVTPDQVIRNGDVLWVEKVQLDPLPRERARLFRQTARL
jgi:tetratricopeptide (TPR) repeat protein